VGPTEPIGLEKNWIPSAPGRAWFVYVRLYAPLESYFNGMPLPSFECIIQTLLRQYHMKQSIIVRFIKEKTPGRTFARLSSDIFSKLIGEKIATVTLYIDGMVFLITLDTMGRVNLGFTSCR